MVDYGKWDRFVADLSENDSDEDDGQYSAPIVRSFDKGESIEISKNGYKVKEDRTPSSSQKSPVASASATQDSAESVVEGNKTYALDTNTDTLSQDDDLVLNGGNCNQYLWSQDRHQVSLSIPIEEHLRGKDLKVAFENNSLRITSAPNDTVILDKRLQFAIEVDSDTDSLDWEITSKNTKSSTAIKQTQKYIRIVLKKKSPIPGAIFWWKNVFEGDPVIDVSKIGGRNVQKSSEVANAWKDAHEKFSESVLSREKIPVDI